MNVRVVAISCLVAATGLAGCSSSGGKSSAESARIAGNIGYQLWLARRDGWMSADRRCRECCAENDGGRREHDKVPGT